MAASRASGYTDWTVRFDGAGLDAFGEVVVDRSRVAAEGVLSILYQRRSSGTTRLLLVLAGESFLSFWRERRLGTLTTLRPDGSPHVTPVGVTLDPEAGLARVITSRDSRKARNAAATGRVAICQVDGRRWSTLEGRAVVRDDPAAVAEAERRYAERYRVPRANPKRVVIEISVARVLGNA